MKLTGDRNRQPGQAESPASSHALGKGWVLRSGLTDRLAKMSTGGVFFLVAGQRGGKSTVLVQFQDILGNSALCIFLTAHSWPEDLCSASTKMAPKWLLLDGYDILPDEDQLALSDMCIWLHLRRGCTVVIACRVPPVELERIVWAEPFDEGETLALARQLYPVTRPVDLARAVHELTQGQPYLTRLLLTQPGLTAASMGPAKAWDILCHRHPVLIELARTVAEAKEVLAGISQLTLGELVYEAHHNDEVRKLFEAGLIGGPPDDRGAPKLLKLTLPATVVSDEDPWIWDSRTRNWRRISPQEVSRVVKCGLVVDIRSHATVYIDGNPWTSGDDKARFMAILALLLTRGHAWASRSEIAKALMTNRDALRRLLYRVRFELGAFAKYLSTNGDLVGLNGPVTILAAPGPVPPASGVTL